MKSVWYQLFWKECREHFWRAVSLTAVLVALPVWTMFDEPEMTYGVMAFALMFYTPLAAVFLAMGIAAGERSTGTVVFIGSLPVKLWKLATAKLVVAYAALMVPVVILLSLVRMWELAWPLIGVTKLGVTAADAGVFPDLVGENGWYVAVAGSAALGGASLLIWAAALGCNFADEIRAAAVALSGILGWWLVTEFVVHELLAALPKEQIGLAMLAAAPGSPAAYPWLLLDAMPGHSDRGLVALIIATPLLIVHSLLAGSFLWRFGRSLPAARPQLKQRLSSAPAMLPPAPRRSKLSAIVWKQFRETGPLALIALVSVAGLALCMTAADFGQLWRSLIVAATIIGVFVVTATGVGLFESDLQPRLHSFWRSRPIHPGLWFWTKLLTGLGLVTAAIYLPVGYGVWTMEFPFYEWNELWFILTLHALAFTSAVMLICLVRRPFYAAILSIGGSVSITVLISEKVPSDGWRIACYVVLIVLTITIAWAAVRWNIGVGRSRAR